MPFLVLGNKIDLGRAASEDELRVELGLHQLTTGKVRRARAICCCLLLLLLLLLLLSCGCSCSTGHRHPATRQMPRPVRAQGKVALNGIRPMELFMCSVVKRAGYGEGARHSTRRTQRAARSMRLTRSARHGPHAAFCARDVRAATAARAAHACVPRQASAGCRTTSSDAGTDARPVRQRACTAVQDGRWLCSGSRESNVAPWCDCATMARSCRSERTVGPAWTPRGAA